ncbi:hypothetical protein [uncultured Flavobacterium sp.]|uniref:hypothetical protein n=1 Tax=uncultured Flavobacterium sp. TaxID=165435 RepID=UPI0025D13941|nr:hypothetical protein [uncultured Flavobacterium sp.]
MRKTFFIATLLLSGFFLASVGSPSDVVLTEKMTANAVVSDTLTWKLLGQIKYIKKPSPDYPEGVMFPVVNTSLKAKNKKQITMSGFIIPIDNKNYALSKNVFASCFFCGQAGPETIMGIKFKNPNMKLKTDQYVTLTGTFRYNDSDVDDWIYHVENAVITKGN